MRPFVVGGTQRAGDKVASVRSPYDGRPIEEVALAGAGDLEDALETAGRGFAAQRRLPSWRRAAPLHEASSRLARERERFARTIALEAGKPIVQARTEVDRAVTTLRVAAEEAGRIGGDVLPLDGAPAGEGRVGLTRRFPVGPVACITPFNFPLNLVAHKVAPALAAGCSVVLKPASATPLSALDLAGLLLECGVEPHAVSVLPLPGADAAPLVEDPRTRALSFTGSPAVGWDLHRRAGRKKVVLELGGNAGVVVDRTADLSRAAARIAAGAFAYAGQSCISVQRVFVHRDVHEPFLELLLASTRTQVVGDPLDEATTVGPMISEDEARRAAAWVESARLGGARVLHGGTRRGAILEPTVLTGTHEDMDVCRKEVFAPVVVVEPFTEMPQALEAIDRSEYGLQAGIFTRDLPAALAAWERLEVGAVIVDDVPTFRADAMPYGGVKGSGTGREGPRWAIEDYTEMRLLVVPSGSG